MERVGFGYRLLATILDIVLIVICLTIPILLFNFHAVGQNNLFGLALGIAYSLTEVFRLATPGGMVLKMRIANLDGSAASVDQLWKRWALKNVGSICQILGLVTGIGLFITLGGVFVVVVAIGCFFVFGANRQTLHDKIAGTSVFKQ